MVIIQFAMLVHQRVTWWNDRHRPGPKAQLQKAASLCHPRREARCRWREAVLFIYPQKRDKYYILYTQHIYIYTYIYICVWHYGIKWYIIIGIPTIISWVSLIPHVTKNFTPGSEGQSQGERKEQGQGEGQGEAVRGQRGAGRRTTFLDLCIRSY